MNATRALIRRSAFLNQGKKLSTQFSSKTAACLTPIINLKDIEYHQNIAPSFNSVETCTCRCFCSTKVLHDRMDTIESPKRKLKVDYDELKMLLQTNSVLLLDVREPKELQEEGKISQAINIPLCQLKKGLQMAEESFCNTFGISKPTCKTNLVFYGRKSVKSEAASEIAYKLGFKKVKHYPGGYEEWKEKEGQK